MSAYYSDESANESQKSETPVDDLRVYADELAERWRGVKIEGQNVEQLSTVFLTCLRQGRRG